jgi:hypothetical protein
MTIEYRKPDAGSRFNFLYQQNVTGFIYFMGSYTFISFYRSLHSVVAVWKIKWK